MKIRPYEDRHFAGIDRLWREVFPGDPPRNRASKSIPAKVAVEDDLLLVAEDEKGEVLGTVMAGYDGHRGWLNAVAVDPSHQREGIGSALVNKACSRLSALGCVKVNLQIRESNEAVVAFYAGLGFSVEPRISMGREIG